MATAVDTRDLQYRTQAWHAFAKFMLVGGALVMVLLAVLGATLL